MLGLHKEQRKFISCITSENSTFLPFPFLPFDLPLHATKEDLESPPLNLPDRLSISELASLIHHYNPQPSSSCLVSPLVLLSPPLENPPFGTSIQPPNAHLHP